MPESVTAPLRKVVKAKWFTSQSIIANVRSRWWDLELECGHIEERPVRYRPAQEGEEPTRRGWKNHGPPVPVERIKPAPKRVRCAYCRSEARHGK